MLKISDRFGFGQITSICTFRFTPEHKRAIVGTILLSAECQRRGRVTRVGFVFAARGRLARSLCDKFDELLEPITTKLHISPSGKILLFWQLLLENFALAKFYIPAETSQSQIPHTTRQTCETHSWSLSDILGVTSVCPIGSLSRRLRSLSTINDRRWLCFRQQVMGPPLS